MNISDRGCYITLVSFKTLYSMKIQGCDTNRPCLIEAYRAKETSDHALNFTIL